MIFQNESRFDSPQETGATDSEVILIYIHNQNESVTKKKSEPKKIVTKTFLTLMDKKEKKQKEEKSAAKKKHSFTVFST